MPLDLTIRFSVHFQDRFVWKVSERLHRGMMSILRRQAGQGLHHGLQQ